MANEEVIETHILRSLTTALEKRKVATLINKVGLKNK